MLCECCKKKIITKRHLGNLFQPETHHICEYCYMKNPLLVKESIIPIEDGEILWYNLLKDEVKYPKAYMSFLAPYILLFTKMNSYDVLIYQDQFNNELYHLLDLLKLGNIFLLTLYENKEKKENDYEI